MSSRAEFHEKCRSKVCGVCLRKPKQFNKISEYTLSLIRKHVYESYSLEDESFPLIICTSCIKTVSVIVSGDSGRKLPDIDYAGLTKPPSKDTRSGSSEKCACSVCIIARMNASEYRAHEKSIRDNPGRPQVKVNVQQETAKLL